MTQEHVTTLPSLYHSQIHTVFLSATQPASISPHIPPTHNTYILFLVSQPVSISPYTHPSHNTYHPILRDPTPISPHTHPKYIQPYSHVPSASISLHTPPPHSQYIQPVSRVPSASIYPHTPPPLTIHTTSFSCLNRRRPPHIHSAFPLLPPY